MRKPKKLTAEELAPYQIDLRPPLGWGTGAGERSEPGEGVPFAARTPLSWVAIFGNDHPVEVEVGFGKGMFLVSAGTANPGTNYFGIEIIRKYQLYATNRLARRKLTNVRTCCTDAKRVLAEDIPAGSVEVVHVFFPDPWWKTKHKKRTLFTSEFADSVVRVLRPGGKLHFVTDVKDYFEMVSGILAAKSAFRLLPPPPASAAAHDLDYLTNFERKFRLEGRPIYRSLYETVPA